MKKVGTVFFILGSVIFLSNLFDIRMITRSGAVQSLADATGGTTSDILGGFGCIFYFISLVSFLMVYRKAKEPSSKWLMISSVILGIANFYFAYSAVL